MSFRFEDLKIWQIAIDFSNNIFEISKSFPKDASFELTNQIRRAALSVPANIAEGSGSNSNADFRNFLNIAVRSIFELVSHLYIAKSREYISEDQYKNLYSKLENLAKQINALKKQLK
ncbi:MAG: four helix bundle protein [bacterium]